MKRELQRCDKCFVPMERMNPTAEGWSLCDICFALQEAYVEPLRG